ncbi:MAG: peroxisomal membrane protein pex14 [Vezdaea aestivalis]|nr:MAG: peroxisomal membrane protein pex14 [Vezdaea aestivalis]
MVREDLISSAVEFLRDPGAAASPLESRIAFLRSKNLTQHEIDTALSRSSDGSPPPPQPTSYSPAPQQQHVQQPLQSQQPYPPYQQQPYWVQQPPPLPRRDWRDWFIMATLTGSVSYALLLLARRYLLPLVLPPTVPQLAQDKASIDASFTRAFTLLDKLTSDTEALKTAETTRSAKLDAALETVNQVAQDLKTTIAKRDEEMRKAQEEIRGLRALVPKALESQKESSDRRLLEIGNELKSLRLLVGTRLAAPTASTSSPPAQKPPTTNGAAKPKEPAEVSAEGKEPQTPIPARVSSTATGNESSSFAASSLFGANGGTPRQASIPAWQMAAAKTPVTE